MPGEVYFELEPAEARSDPEQAVVSFDLVPPEECVDLVPAVVNFDPDPAVAYFDLQLGEEYFDSLERFLAPLHLPGPVVHLQRGV